MLLFLTTGLLLFFFSSTDLNLFSTKQVKKEGSVKTMSGTVMGKSHQDEYFKNLKAGSPLTSPFRVVTGFNSEATLFFGEEFKVAANSSLDLIRKAGRYEIQLVSGKIQRLGKSATVDFFSNNKKALGPEITSNPGPVISHLDDFNLPSKSQASLKKFDPEFQKRLKETFKLHQRFIEKCFIKHYDRVRGKTQTGRVLIQFQVHLKGKIKDIEIMGSDYKDDDFHKCLVEVVSRVQLKYFEGPTMTVNFPIKLQLPQ